MTPKGIAAAIDGAIAPLGDQPGFLQYLQVLRDSGAADRQALGNCSDRPRRGEDALGTRRLYAANPRALGELRAAIEAMWHVALAGMAAAIDKEQEG